MQNNHILKSIFLCLAILITLSESSAFTLIINSDTNIKNLKLAEHNSTGPIKLSVGHNEMGLENYPNAVYLYQTKGSSYNYLSMIWVPSDTSTIQISIDAEYKIKFLDESQYQQELSKIFSSSNTFSLFPYTPHDNKPLEPILALEAKAIIQNLKVYTDQSVLKNLLKLSKQRGINNWSTEVLSAHLKEPSYQFYDQSASKLIKINGIDSLENHIEIKPNGNEYLLLAVSGSWCGPCIKGLPKLRKVYDSVSDKVIFVSAWNDPDLDTFRNNHRDKKHVITWPNLLDQYGVMSNAFQIKAYPSYILFDPLGNEITRWEGKFPNDITKYISN